MMATASGWRTAGSTKDGFNYGRAMAAWLTRSQFEALILGLPWERLADGGVIRVL
jgi:hypothetical protein